MDNYDYSSEYDNEFDKSNLIKFYPFVGSKYKSKSPKIMILGESHYFDPNLDISNLNKEQLDELDGDKYYSRAVIINDYFSSIRENSTNPNKWIQCYRYTSAMIAGKGYHLSDYVWDYISFYNFFQKSIGHGAGSQKFITEELIENSKKAYFEVIKILEPNLIIAWGVGKLLYKWVPKENIIEIDKVTYKYNDFPNTIIMHYPHPSRGFPYQSFHEHFMGKIKKLEIDLNNIIG